MENKDYFEGVLQLRNCTKEVVDFVRDMIDNEEGVWVAKEKGTKEGFDFYLSSNRFLKKIGRILKSKFPGIVKSSSKIHTRDRQTSKSVYRGTILFRMACFSDGDFGVYRGDEVEVISVGDKVVLRDRKSGKKMQHKFDDVNKNFRKS